MLELREIVKEYTGNGSSVVALKDINLQFRDSEFVAILGPSGGGKTTLLNIIGGLDTYTSGDLLIDGISTKTYKDKNWDTYRNHRVGFVFQSYNLIPHQSVLSNVELALTISGVSSAERKQRAKNALISVALKDHINKRPNQLSGGQMQRVAIARALVNEPNILLADEPTGALDSDTSVQIMDLLKEIANDRLVIMVTHNPELAQDYADRIVRIKDGRIVDDSHPLSNGDQASEGDTIKPSKKKKQKNANQENDFTKQAAEKSKRRTRMSTLTAFSLSANNLLTKKGRTLLTAFAGSIGIIGIALILSLSDGAQKYITQQEEETMGSYPITIQETSFNIASLMGSFFGMDNSHSTEPVEGNEVPTWTVMNEILDAFVNDSNKNDMVSIKKWLETNPDSLNDYVSDIRYSYATPLNVYRQIDDEVAQINPETVTQSLGITRGNFSAVSVTSTSSNDVWTLMSSDKKVAELSYELIEGAWPQAYNEVVIALDETGALSDYAMYALGLEDQKKLKDLMRDAENGKEVSAPKVGKHTKDELLNLVFKVVPQSDLYKKDDGVWVDKSGDKAFMRDVVDNAEEIKVVGIVRSMNSEYGAVLYTHELIDHIISKIDSSDIVKEQKQKPLVDVLSGYDFPTESDEEITLEIMFEQLDKLPGEQGQQAKAFFMQMQYAGSSEEEILSTYNDMVSQMVENSSYEGNLEKFGVADLDDPAIIEIYPRDFEAKEKIDEIISNYNSKASSDKVIHYTDIVGAMMSSVTSIVNSITYILIAFVAISLIVSSIMIGIITYISVLERTKEIGILRSIGASKRDVSKVFTAETFIIGLFAGLLGVGVTAALNILVNMIIERVAGVAHMAALPLQAAVILVVISVVLTLIGGALPARLAAKQDPVKALRSE